MKLKIGILAGAVLAGAVAFGQARSTLKCVKLGLTDKV